MCCCEYRVCAQSLCSGFFFFFGLFHCSLCQPGNSAQVSEPIQESFLPLLFVFPSFLELFSPSYAPCSAVSGSVACYLSRYQARLLAKLHFPLIQRPTSLCLLRSSLSKACGSLSDSVMSFPAAGVLQVKGSPLPLVSTPFFLSSSQEHPYFHVRSSVFAQGLIFPMTPGIFISPAFCYSLLEQLSFLFPYIFS